MNENSIELRSIGALLKDFAFWIPSYQRGYRWTEQQVRDLLNDLYEFAKNKTGNEFYCLQPVVVKQAGDRWEVIDGQQRLTTIHIILNYIRERFQGNRGLFTITYQSRAGSGEYLNLMDEGKRNDNIDFYYMWMARACVKEWFEEKDSFLAFTKIYPVLIENTKVIWYEVNDDTDPRKIFTRLNVGKIPLTNAELIKALFLKSENFSLGENNVKRILLKQLEIAGEWDRIEYALQNNAFWYFLSNEEPPKDGRIGLLFDVIAGTNEQSDDYQAFRYFNDEFQQASSAESLGKKTESLWASVKKCYLTLEEWFSDPVLFHLLGYLFALQPNKRQGGSIHHIRKYQEKSLSMTKTAFREYLQNEIGASVNTDIDTLRYENKVRVRQLLLLFNIQTLLNSGDPNSRFQFDRFKNEKWDIEHIHSVQSQLPEDSINQQKDWLKVLLDDWGHKLPGELCDRIQHFLDNNEKERGSAFMDLAGDILKLTGGQEDIDDIGNLTLLDAGTNRGYKNAIFAVKRRKILQRDESGIFIPVCTKNVFLKHYTQDPEQLTVWTAADREGYRDKIFLTLQPYFS